MKEIFNNQKRVIEISLWKVIAPERRQRKLSEEEKEKTKIAHIKNSVFRTSKLSKLPSHNNTHIS